jgi:two-component system response regulator
LLVEDNPDDELLTSNALRSANVGNKLVVTRDGAAALDYLFAQGAHIHRDISDLPAVVLLDLNLPKKHGLEVLRSIREDRHTRKLPVVILTSSMEDEFRLKDVALGANSFLRKPLDMDHFFKVTGQLGLHWVLLNKTSAGGEGIVPGRSNP